MQVVLASRKQYPCPPNATHRLSAPPHSLSATHSTQSSTDPRSVPVHAFVAGSQENTPQSATSVATVHSTQVPPSQFGASLGQASADVQPEHAPAMHSAASSAVQSSSPRHSTQVLRARSHSLAAPSQSSDEAHSTHAPASQIGVSPPQSRFAVHATHVDDVGSHSGVSPPQSSFEVQATQRPASQSGVSPPQSSARRHATQRNVSPSPSAGLSQRGVAAGQCSSSKQGTQSPVARSHCAVSPAQAGSQGVDGFLVLQPAMALSSTAAMNEVEVMVRIRSSPEGEAHPR